MSSILAAKWLWHITHSTLPQHHIAPIAHFLHIIPPSLSLFTMFPVSSHAVNCQVKAKCKTINLKCPPIPSGNKWKVVRDESDVYQFFSVRMVCDSWQRGMASIWLRSFETMVEKAGWPLYPGSSEKSGYVPDPKHGTKIHLHLTRYTGWQLTIYVKINSL